MYSEDSVAPPFAAKGGNHSSGSDQVYIWSSSERTVHIFNSRHLPGTFNSPASGTIIACFTSVLNTQIVLLDRACSQEVWAVFLLGRFYASAFTTADRDFCDLSTSPSTCTDHISP